MKRVLLTLLAVLFVLSLLGAVGFAGYRLGFRQGVLAASDGDRLFITPREFGFGMGPGRMPMHEFGFQRGDDVAEADLVAVKKVSFPPTWKPSTNEHDVAVLEVEALERRNLCHDLHHPCSTPRRPHL